MKVWRVVQLVTGDRFTIQKSGDGGRDSSLLDPSESLALRVSRLGYIYFWGCMCS